MNPQRERLMDTGRVRQIKQASRSELLERKGMCPRTDLERFQLRITERRELDSVPMGALKPSLENVSLLVTVKLSCESRA